MNKKLSALTDAIDVLDEQYGSPGEPASADPFELVLYENVAYLAPPARRREAFELLRSTVGTTPQAILKATRAALQRVTAKGILKSTFAGKLRACAIVAVEKCDGDLTAVVRGPLDVAKKALRDFPGIGEPGAEKILLFSGRHPFLAPDSNALRVLVRLGLLADDDNYARLYAASRELSRELTQSCAAMQRAHLILQHHGKTLCKRTTPKCRQCALAQRCPTALV